MMNFSVNQNSDIDSDRRKAIATARMLNYAATDASELGLEECAQLLYFISDDVIIKFKIHKVKHYADQKRNNDKDIERDIIQ